MWYKNLSFKSNKLTLEKFVYVCVCERDRLNVCTNGRRQHCACNVDVNAIVDFTHLYVLCTYVSVCVCVCVCQPMQTGLAANRLSIRVSV